MGIYYYVLSVCLKIFIIKWGMFIATGILTISKKAIN